MKNTPSKHLKYLLILWSIMISCCAQQQTGNTLVYVTKTGVKYHLESCIHLEKSKKAIMLSEAVKKGYTPCSECSPPKYRPARVATDSSQMAPQVREAAHHGKKVRCSVITQNGTRCKRKTSNASGRCSQHEK